MSPAERQYQRIAADLRRRIDLGEWQIGDVLPSRAKLAIEYDVDPNVLQRAQQLLITEGLLEGRSGSGTYVRRPVPRRAMVRSRIGTPASFRADLGEIDGTGSWESSTGTNVPAPPEAAARLGLEPGTPTVHTVYEFLIDSQPVLLANSWEPLALTEGSPVICPVRPAGRARAWCAGWRRSGCRWSARWSGPAPPAPPRSRPTCSGCRPTTW